jgi:hypothetical protein
VRAIADHAVIAARQGRSNTADRRIAARPARLTHARAIGVVGTLRVTRARIGAGFTARVAGAAGFWKVVSIDCGVCCGVQIQSCVWLGNHPSFSAGGIDLGVWMRGFDQTTASDQNGAGKKPDGES